MIRILYVAVCTLIVLSAAAAPAQEPDGPPPELDKLKHWVGTWDATMKAGDQEFKGVANAKFDLGGMWLATEFEGDFGGRKFTGRGFDSYDPRKKKHVSVWVDSMMPAMVVLEGEFDKEGRVLTMKGEGPGMDGSQMKLRSVTRFSDPQTIVWTMHETAKDGKEAATLTIVYKRRKGS